MEAKQAWNILQETMDAMESGQGEWGDLVSQAQGAIALLLECDPSEVMAAIPQDRARAKAIVSWVLYEAGKIPGVEQDKIHKLAQHWDQMVPPAWKIIPAPVPAG